MRPIELKVTRIGNSRGVRIPAGTLARYQVGESLIMEERSDGILLRSPGAATAKLTWQETAREMAESTEDWSDWNDLRDGLDAIPWEPTQPRRVAEPVPKRRSNRGRGK